MNPLGLFELVGELLRRVVPDRQQADKLNADIESERARGGLQTIEAAFNALKLDQTSRDKFIARTRPMFLRIFYFLILVGPLAAACAIFWPQHIDRFISTLERYYAAVPRELWVLFGLTLVYLPLRTVEKLYGVTK